MVIEYIEKGQVMVCDLETMKFTSPITRMLIKYCIHVDTILTEDQARSYLNDIISGLKYCM